MNAAELIKALGGSHGEARCPAHDDRTPSLSIRDGDNGRLLTHCHAGCEPATVWNAFTRLGLVATSFDHRQMAPSRTISNVPKRRHSDNSDRARSIWRTSHPIEEKADETPVEAYLASRGITIPIPLSLRYHPALKHGPTGLHFPAMVAGVQAPDRQIAAIHRTYLLPDGSGKAQVSEPKMALGPIGNGAVRLSAYAKVLGLAEGIETALSAQQLFEIPMWAALGARMDKMTMPANVIEVQIFGDNGKEGHEAAMKARDVFIRTGKRVAVRYPPEQFSDWNDALPHWHERPVCDWEF